MPEKCKFEEINAKKLEMLKQVEKNFIIYYEIYDRMILLQSKCDNIQRKAIKTKFKDCDTEECKFEELNKEKLDERYLLDKTMKEWFDTSSACYKADVAANDLYMEYLKIEWKHC